MSYYLFVWIATIGYGLFAIAVKLTNKHSIPNPWLYNFLLQLVVLIITIPIALTNGVSLPQKWDNIIYASLFYAAFGIFYILSLKWLDVTNYVPLFNFRTIFSILLGILFLGEIIQSNQLIFIVLIIIGGFAVSLDEKLKLSSFLRWPIIVAMLSMIFLSFNSLFINIAIAQNNYWQVSLWQYIITQLILLATVPLFIKDLKTLRKNQILAIIFSAFIFVIADLTANKAYAENIGLSSVIISLPISMVFALLFSIFAPKLLEKHTLKVYVIRFISAGVMIFSALQLSR